MKKLTKTLIPLSLGLFMATGCVTPGVTEHDSNAATKQGALGGALVGLTLGALTGDSELAVKGAIAGGVTGGVSGAAVDLQHHRDTQKTHVMADAIAARPTVVAAESNGGPEVVYAGAPSPQARLQGNWNVHIWATDEGGKTHAAQAQAKGVLLTAELTKLDINSVVVNEQLVDLHLDSQFTFDRELGPRINIRASNSNTTETYAGMALEGGAGYQYYSVDTDNHARIELKFVNDDLWLLETYVYRPEGEVKAQTYRFSRA